jgi:hypothetical protein
LECKRGRERENNIFRREDWGKKILYRNVDPLLCSEQQMEVLDLVCAKLHEEAGIFKVLIGEHFFLNCFQYL